MSEWTNVPKSIRSYQGFTYMITHVPTGKYYIGSKTFWSKRTRPPLKGRKNKRHYVIESDWKTYWGSSNNLLEDVKKYGEKEFTREIIALGISKFECAYNELCFQMGFEVLFDPQAYNEIINVRLRKRK